MRYLALILFILCCFSAEAQRKKKKESEWPKMGYAYKKLFTKEQLRNQFPYNKSKKVVLVAYTEPPQVPTEDTAIINESLRRSNKGKDTLGFISVREIVVLNEEQTDSLNSMWHNIEFYGGMADAAGCYYPRNSILFLDEDNERVAYIDFCFQCGHYRTPNEELSLRAAHNDLLELIRNFFEYMGVKYGITER